jgi:tripartite ATP-independent transporter DctM subunit
MLIVYGPVAGVSISLLFFAAMVPGIIMGLTYIVYIVIVAFIWPHKAPAATIEEMAQYTKKDIAKLLLYAGAPPMALIFSVLGGIFFGFAAPTEAAALGSLGAFILTLIYKKFSFKMLRDSCYSSLGISSFIMWLVLGAKFFMTSFNKLGGGAMIERALLGLNVGPDWMLVVMLGIIFVLGFIMDWIGILLVVVPIFVPIVDMMKWDPLWFGVMFGVTLQISYITPPFAYSIFYLKGIAPKGVTLADICYGCVPFIFLQFIDLFIFYIWPEIALYLPRLMTAAK